MKQKELKYFIGADVHKSTTTLTIMDDRRKVIDSVCLPTRVPILRAYLEQHSGPKGLVIEEMGLAQWLYTTLKPFVDELIVCDPYRNHLLKEGAKTDPIDSLKLAQLYQAGFLKPVFHSADRLMDLRNIVHVYRETVRASVRIQNQYEAYLTKNGIETKSNDFRDSWDLQLQREREVFLERQKRQILKHMQDLSRTIPAIGHLKSIGGIGIVGSFTILAAVVDPKRFRSKKVFWSYCGLVKHPRQSGQRIYGYTNVRYNRELKNVFKRAAVIVLATKGELRNYYDGLREKGLAEHHARHALARKIAAISLSCLKHQRSFEASRLH
jgi:transposase